MANEMLEGDFYSHMYEDQQASRDWNRYVLEFYVQQFEQGCFGFGCDLLLLG